MRSVTLFVKATNIKYFLGYSLQVLLLHLQIFRVNFTAFDLARDELWARCMYVTQLSNALYLCICVAMAHVGRPIPFGMFTQLHAFHAT